MKHLGIMKGHAIQSPMEKVQGH